MADEQTPEELAAIEAKVKELGALAAGWTDEEFAARIVGLLIEDKGFINAWQRTIEFMIRVAREREKLR